MAWVAADVHHCRADLYDGTYRIASGDGGIDLVVDMTVSGPAKDYRIVTTYRRPALHPR